MVTIKLINGLGNLFKIYLTILGQKAKNKNKLPNLQVLFFNLKNKKRYIKQSIKVNLAQSQSNILNNVLLKNGSSLHI